MHGDTLKFDRMESKTLFRIAIFISYRRPLLFFSELLLPTGT